MTITQRIVKIWDVADPYLSTGDYITREAERAINAAIETAIQEAVAEEREACAKIVESNIHRSAIASQNSMLDYILNAIRARKNSPCS